MAMLATLSAVVLGLLTGSAISSLAEKENELRSAGVQFIMLDRTLAAYGPETKDARDLLKRLLAERIGQIWPEEGGNVSLAALSAGAGVDMVQQDLFAMSPQTDEQRWLQSNALQIANKIAESRWTTVEQIGSRFPWPFFVIVVFWLAIIFASFGLFAPRNASVTAALFVAALGLAGAIFMILEMDQPYSGVVKIPSTVAPHRTGSARPLVTPACRKSGANPHDVAPRISVKPTSVTGGTGSPSIRASAYLPASRPSS